MSSKTRPAPPIPVPQNYNPPLPYGAPGTATPPPLPGQLARQVVNTSQTSFSSQTASSRSYPSEETIYRRNEHTLLPYFYSNFSNPNEVADYLKFHAKGKAGHFLLRPSFRNPKTQLTISVVVQDKTVRHTNILIENQGQGTKYYLVKEKKFDAVEELISYYRTNEVKNLQNVKNVRFLYPVETGRGRSVNDNGSASSECSYDRYHSPGSSAGVMDLPAPIPQDRPPLPARPKDLPRRNSSHSGSLGSPGSVFAPSPSASGPSISEDFSYGQEGPGAIGLPHGAAGSHMSLASNMSGLTSFPSTSSVDVDARPPAPLPMTHNSADKTLYYSTPRNVNEDISERLKEVLKQSERCDCGIPRDMSDLPSGWTVHRSKDKGTYGRIFYQSSRGTTSWKLPEEIQRKLTAMHRANLNKLSYMQQRNLFHSSYLDNTRQAMNGERSSGPNSGSGGNLDPRQISGSSGSGGQTSGRVEPQVRVTHLTQF